MLTLDQLSLDWTLVLVMLVSFALMLGGVMALFYNVLQRRKVEARLRETIRKTQETERTYQTLFEEHTAIMLLIEAESGRIIQVNPAAAEFYGWSVEQLEQMTIQDIDVLTLEQIKKVRYKNQMPSNVGVNFQHRKSDGTIIDVEVFASSVIVSGKKMFFFIVIDVTEKHKNARMLKLLSRSVEQSSVSTIITDREGAVEYANPAFTQNTGYTFEEVKGKGLGILKTDAYPDSVYLEMWKSILSGQTWFGTLQLKRKSGALYWAKLVISPIFERGAVVNVVAVSEDVTERMNHIHALKMAKLEAEESNRLKTEFLHNISHEIRTPLNSIIGFSTILAQPDTTDEDRAAYLEVVLQSTRDLMRMMDNVIELSRLEACRRDVRMDTIQLNNLLQSLVYQYLPLAQQKHLNLELRSGLPDAEATVKSDVALLSRILNNLLDNAVKFTDSGRIELGYRVEGQELTLYVNDTGIGVAEENFERIFERFVQEENGLTRGFGGLGLGLSISKESAALLNARLWVESQKGRGSTFYLTIPYIP